MIYVDQMDVNYNLGETTVVGEEQIVILQLCLSVV